MCLDFMGYLIVVVVQCITSQKIDIGGTKY